jgi:hypothetical protein
MPWNNHDAIHRHACHAYEDFRQLRHDPGNDELWHSMSHHLRHVVFRSGHETKYKRIENIRRARVSKRHR